MKHRALRKRYGRSAGGLRLLTLDGGWRGESVPARVGMLVRSRRGSDESYVTRVDSAKGRIAVKPAHWAGHEHWGDADWFFAMGRAG